MKLYIRTRNGDQYHVLSNGNIKRLDQKDFVPSGHWIFNGLVPMNNNMLACYWPLESLLSGALPESLLYKNGNPRYTVIDVDHGTRRVWGNGNGVVDIRVLPD